MSKLGNLLIFPVVKWYMRKGFTLVEICLVLVIIGLLTGGILAANSFFSAAKTRKYVSRLEQYEIAVQNFKQNFQSIPGDSPFFIPPGNNSGLHDASSGCNGLYDTGESTQVWAHLSQAHMIAEHYEPYQPQMCGGPHDDYVSNNTKVVVPEFNQDVRGLTFLKTKSIPLHYNHQTNRNYGSHIDPNIAMAMDQKMDDGNNAQGHFRAVEGIYLGSVTCHEYVFVTSPSNPHTYPKETLCQINWYPDSSPNI